MLRRPRRLFQLVLSLSFFAGLLAPAALPGQSADETPEPYRSLPARLQARANEFPLVPVATGDSPALITEITLNGSPEVFDNGQAFDAVRFRAPDQPGLDLVWAFSIPPSWRQWYILPASGAPKRGFEKWFDADRAYSGLAGSATRPITLQTLAADYFEPGQEYLLWFSQTKHTADAATLKLSLRFVSPRPENEPWDNPSIETALKLETAPVAEQAAYFNSRGARILLDAELFHPADADSQMDSFLTTRRQTSFLQGGYFVTMESHFPPCHSSPKLADILRRHGKPDCELTAEHYGTTDENKDTPPEYDSYYYDYFIFETSPTDPEKRVLRVSSQYFNTASAVPSSAQASTWTDVTLAAREYRLFFRDGHEVARYLDWQKPDARLVSGAVPAGVYLLSYDNGSPMEKLTHDGNGGWDYESFYRNGPVYRRSHYRGGILHGKLEDFFENGSTRASAHYENGRLHGKLQMWSEDGTLTRDQQFEQGELVRP